MDLLGTIVDVLLPRRCLLCQQQSLEAKLCAPCYQDLPWTRSACRRCALPLPNTVDCCGDCLARPPSFDHCWTAFHYASPVDRLIGQFKNQRQLRAGRLLSTLLLDAFQRSPSPLALPDLLVPVPLHWRRQLGRGFNQAAFVAESLARELKLPLNGVAKRRFATPKQQQLKRKQRLGNLRDVFAVNAPAVLERHVVIVDDVITTGATAEALSWQLKRAGARRVDVWALARTPAPTSPAG